MSDRSGILPGSPLVLTLASIRFAPWPSVANQINEIHEQLRDVFPLLQPLSMQQVTVSNTLETIQLWMLMSADRSLSVQISQDQVLFAASAYNRYAEFSKLIQRILAALIVRMKFMHHMSLGVRYVDHIRPVRGEPLELYLHSNLLAPSYPGLTTVGGVGFATYQLNEMELRVRSTTQPEVPHLPEDLVPWLAMVSAPGQFKIQQLKKNECTIDIDAVLQVEIPERVDDSSLVMEKLDALHKIANAFFRREDVFTDHAFEVWKQG